MVLEEAPERSLAVALDPLRAKSFVSSLERLVLERVGGAVAAIHEGQFTAAFAQLHGVGWGLTPCGDDFIAGMVMAKFVLLHLGYEVRMSQLPESKGLVGAFLKQVERGNFDEPWRHLLQLLVSDGSDEGAMREAVRRVLRMGATSGADMAAGFLMMMKRGLAC